MEIKDAVRNAMAFARESLGAERTADIRLEEIESSTSEDGTPVWLITLSSETIPQGKQQRAFAAVRETIGTDAEREYKVFTVKKDTGEILSMKIRLLAIPYA